MKNLQVAFKKFLSNKNTVTILGVVVCIIILYVGYNAQIRRTTDLVSMPVAFVDIGPKTLIKKEHVTIINVPRKLLNGEFYEREADIVGKYSNYNATIPLGSLFYKKLLVDAKNMPSVVFSDVPDGYTVINQPVNMNTTFVNSVEPGSYVNLYFKAIDDKNDDKVIFGRFVSNIKVLSVKDAAGDDVFETSEEKRTPAYILYAVPESINQLIRRALYISDDYGIELLLVPNTKTLTEEDKVHATSDDIKKFILDRTQNIDVNIMPTASELFNDVNSSKDTNKDNKQG